MQKVTLKAGDEINKNVEMRPVFAEVSIKTEPSADIYIDENKKATGEYYGRILSGLHKIEARKVHYHTDEKQINFEIGEKYDFTMIVKPKYGSLTIETSPIEVNISLNGENQGNTPLKLNKLLEGDYMLNLNKPGYAPVNKIITINENKITKINENLKNGQNVTFKSNPSGATLILDGENIGKTPITLFVPFSSCSVLLKFNETYNDYIEIIDIAPGKTEYEFTLVQKGKKIVFDSKPKGATIIIDGKSFTAPHSIFLKPGVYNYSVKEEKYETREETINTADVSEYNLIKLKPSSFGGFGYISGPGSVGGEFFIWGRHTGVVLTFMGITPLEDLPFENYSNFGFSGQLGYRVVYPYDFVIHGGYGTRMFTNKDNTDETEQFSAFVIGATIPIRLGRNFGFYFKTDYWTDTEKNGIILYSGGIIF
jgi:hypothetical protein